MKNRKYFFLTFLFLLLLSSCTRKEKFSSRYYLDDKVYWAKGSATQTINQAQRLDFQKLEKLEYCNISDLVGTDTTYVWLRIKFQFPDILKGQSVGLVFPYIHYAERLWFNDVFVGGYGGFDPEPYSPLYQSHFYVLPEADTNTNGDNYIYIQLLSQGLSTVSSGIFIDEYTRALEYSNKISFANSDFYGTISGFLFCSFILFLILFFARKERYIFTFSIICLSTVIFIMYFFSDSIPGYGTSFSAFRFTKLTLCCFFYICIFSIVAFTLNFVEAEQSRWFIIFKHIVLFTSIGITLAMPNYHYLMKLTKPMMITYFIHFCLGGVYMALALFNKAKRKKALIAIAGFSPTAIGMIADVIIRNILRNINHPYFAIYGWIITIAYFIIYLSVDYNNLYLRNKSLSEDLQKEVDIQTCDIKIAKEKLEQEVFQNKRDMDMAALVQQKFFPKPPVEFDDWEIGIAYDALDIVSGDLFDFYYEYNKLNGFSLFDASGHGVAAALITMLSKNIIFKSYKKSQIENQPVSEALNEVNDRFITAKGEVENYLTGVMITFKYEDETASISLASAGHPYPIFYSAKDDKIISLKDLESGPHFGAIGMEGIDVAFPDINFQMNKGDILLCFSDGLTETSNSAHEEFGRSRVEQLLKENNNKTPEQIISIFEKTVQEFRGDNPRDDDITVVLFKKK